LVDRCRTGRSSAGCRRSSLQALGTVGETTARPLVLLNAPDSGALQEDAAIKLKLRTLAAVAIGTLILVTVAA